MTQANESTLTAVSDVIHDALMNPDAYGLSVLELESTLFTLTALYAKFTGQESAFSESTARIRSETDVEFGGFSRGFLRDYYPSWEQQQSSEVKEYVVKKYSALLNDLGLKIPGTNQKRQDS